MAVTKRLRYEILRRDNHTCRYCGQSAPDVKLTVDHVVPVALGGGDEPTNLVTACAACNSGKSATPPDAPLVSDVAQDAMRWAYAIRVVAQNAAHEFWTHRGEQDDFLRAWNDWTYGPEHDRRPVPIGSGWRESLTSFVAAGMTLELLQEECIPIAMNSRATPDDTWRYFCGVVWRKVETLRERATAYERQMPPGPPPAANAWDEL